MSVFVAVCKRKEVKGFPQTGCEWTISIPDVIHPDKESAVRYYRSIGITDGQIGRFSFIDADEFSAFVSKLKWIQDEE